MFRRAKGTPRAECGVFDDAVVHERELFVCMRVGVFFRRRAVRRPARVPDAAMPSERAGGSEFLDPALSLDDAQNVSVEHGDTRRVVAAVFEFLKAV